MKQDLSLIRALFHLAKQIPVFRSAVYPPKTNNHIMWLFYRQRLENLPPLDNARAEISKLPHFLRFHSNMVYGNVKQFILFHYFIQLFMSLFD